MMSCCQFFQQKNFYFFLIKKHWYTHVHYSDQESSSWQENRQIEVVFKLVGFNATCHIEFMQQDNNFSFLFKSLSLIKLFPSLLYYFGFGFHGTRPTSADCSGYKCNELAGQQWALRYFNKMPQYSVTSQQHSLLRVWRARNLIS
jgi:hypothetical protein